MVCSSELEDSHYLNQICRLGLQAAGCSGHLFNQCRILLGDLVHLHDRLAHLRDAGSLFIAGSADLAHQIGNPFNGIDHLGHGGSCLVYQRGALLYPLHTGVDQRLDLLGSLGRTPSQTANLGRHHRKATALLACAGGLYRCIVRQNIGLEGDSVDHTDDVTDLAAGIVDAFHGLHHLAYHLAAAHGNG